MADDTPRKTPRKRAPAKATPPPRAEPAAAAPPLPPPPTRRRTGSTARTRAASREEQAPGQLLKRGARIASVMARHGLKDFAFGDGADPEMERRRARSFRDALQELGPTFSKLGQILSTRPDLLPAAFIEELETLQEKVTPLTEREVVQAIESSLGVPWEDAFASIEPEPLAAATIAQVHRATLFDGSPVVLKVQRPDAERLITQDLDLLRLFAEKTAKRDAIRRMVDVPAVTEYLAEGLRLELDFTNEAKNIERMREILALYPRLDVPLVYETFTGPRLLVMEDIRGVPIREAPLGSERTEAARQLLESYYRQVLSEGFFHADPHPGNLRWYRDRIYFLDFGMVGELDQGLREALLLMVMALWQEDAAFLSEAILSLSDRDPSIDIDLEGYTADMGKILARYRHLSLKEIQLGPLLTEVTTVALRHDVRLPASLALTAKALAQMQLAAAELDPELDPFGVAGSFLAKHLLGKVRSRISPSKLLYEASKTQARFARLLSAVENLMSGAKGGRLQVQFRGTERLEDIVRRAGRRMSLAVGAAAALLSASIAADASAVPEWAVRVGLGLGGAFTLALGWDLLRRR